jgi:hypothetical protein
MNSHRQVVHSDLSQFWLRSGGNIHFAENSEVVTASPFSETLNFDNTIFT